MHATATARSFSEVTLSVRGFEPGERLLRDIAQYNALVELTSHAKGADAWLAKLT